MPVDIAKAYFEILQLREEVRKAELACIGSGWDWAEGETRERTRTEPRKSRSQRVGDWGKK